MVPFVRLLYPNTVIQFQQDHSSIHDSNWVQEWLLVQTYVECSDCPPQPFGMSPIDNMWIEVKKTIQMSCPDLPPKNSDTLLTENCDKYVATQH